MPSICCEPIRRSADTACRRAEALASPSLFCPGQGSCAPPSRKRKAPVHQGLLRIRGFKQTKRTGRRCTPMGNGAPPSRKQKAPVHQGLLRKRGFRQTKRTGRRQTPAGSNKPAGPANGACRLGDKRKAPVHQGLVASGDLNRQNGLAVGRLPWGTASLPGLPTGPAAWGTDKKPLFIRALWHQGI